MHQDTFTVIKLVQNLTNSLRGNTNIYDAHYVESIKKRLPDIEQAFIELKNYFENNN
ncbi:hypothetical protein [Calidifontibacillus erzurumensis]|uniref:Uncharacterized protein n=1 Tax=Calidifontibacillus erzurumensis TaxID=2741433 RepID=A0A8J8GDZ0_9BACI|nr:hypothetical protein [Calidifontibacillus erzurumensis]NSL50643.1 hypothetical protein [Calidifontibacillus erzurumensis]